MERYLLNKYLTSFNNRINDLKIALNISNKEILLKEIEVKINKDDFWSNQEEATNIISQANLIREDINLYNELNDNYEALNELISISSDEDLNMLDEDVLKLDSLFEQAEKKALLSDKYDYNDAILELHPGAGGTESMDWALMLYRMYLRYADMKGYKVIVTEYLAGEEAGIKSVSIMIKGPYAYGMLKSERGVHRLVRISPFDSGSRRHTSFTSCMVTPVIEQTDDIKIKDEDVRIDVYHSSGAGGQSVNTTDSAVRLTHLPTNIVVTCQNERSQLKNKEVAFKILKSKLVELEIEKRENELLKLQGKKSGIDFGSQIRSYIFCPYTLVKDHRTNFETNNVNQVMDGNIEGFILAYLKYERSLKNE